MKRRKSLQSALVLQFAGVALGPLLLFGLMAADYVTRENLGKIQADLRGHALNIRDETVQFLDEMQRDLSLVRNVLDQHLHDNPQQADLYLQDVADSYRHFESIYLLDANARIKAIGLDRQFTSNPQDFRNLDLSGHLLLRQEESQSGTVWSEPFVSLATGEPSLSLTLPLKGDRILFATVSLRQLSDYLERNIWPHPETSFAIVDHRGTLLAHSRFELAQQRFNLRDHAEIRQALETGREVAFNYHEDRSLLESVCLIPATGWVVYASQSSTVALQSSQRLRWLLGGGLAAAACCGILISLLISRRLIRPVARLRDAARQTAIGSYDQAMPGSSYTELDDLANSFGQMQAAVQRREASLRSSQERFQDLVESIDGIVWELDFATVRFTYVSHHVEQVLGYTVSDWLEQRGLWRKHLHPDDRRWAIEFCLDQAKQGRDHQLEFRMRHRRGHYLWLKNLVSVHREEGKVARLNGVIIDITRRKEAEFHLLKTRDRLQQLIEHMPLACIVWDAGFRIEQWNPAAETIFGYTAEQAIGRKPCGFIFDDRLENEVRALWQDLLAGKRILTNTSENLARGGKRIVCEWHSTPLCDETGRMTGAVSMVQDISRRQAAEQATRESEERFRTIFQTSPDAILISRLADGRILDVNDTVVSMSGFSRDELLGRTSLELGLWASAADRERFFEQVLEHGRVENFESRILLAGRTPAESLISARQVTLNGQDCVLSVVRDISALKAAEANLRRSEERFRSLIRVMAEGLMIQGEDGRIIECNPAAERILGLSRERILAHHDDQPVWSAIREDGSNLPPEQLPEKQTLRTGQATSNQVIGLEMADGSVKWLQVNSQPLAPGLDDRPAAVVITFADVTRLKGVESGLRASQRHLQHLTRQFEALLQAIPDRIMVLDRDLRVSWLNRHDPNVDGAFNEQVVGARCHEIVGIQCQHLRDLQGDTHHPCLAARCFREGRTLEEQMTTSSGRIFAQRAFPIWNERGEEVVNVLEISQEITQSVRLQEQAIRTSQLASLGELAAGVAHEINNPINGIINYAQLVLNRTAETSREAEMLRRIQREGDRIATIVKELLFFARDSAQETSLIDVREAVEDALVLSRTHLRKEGILLTVDIPENLPKIRSFGHQVQQLILNLLSNSRHALAERFPDNDPRKTLEIVGEISQVDNRMLVRLKVRDQGIGIPPDLLPRILTPFVTTKPAGVGTGLGLSISHEIVRKHGGKIEIASEPGQFTEVRVDFPAA